MKFDRHSTALDVVRGLDLSGKIALVTGGGAGIGLATTQALATAGAHVIVADINETDSRAAIAELLQGLPTARIDFQRLDLGSLDEVRRFATGLQARLTRLDILVCNAGVMACPLAYTVDGHERQFAVNFLGHYLLVRLLQPLLVNAAGARVVSVSSIGHRRSDIVFDDIDYRQREYDRWKAYGQSKTACSLLAIAVDELWREQGVRANTMNPGGSLTGLHQFLTDEERRKQGFLGDNDKVPDRWRTPEQCAGTSVWLACSPDLDGVGGKYFEDFAEAPGYRCEDPMKGVLPYAISPENARRLWATAAVMVGIQD